MRCFWIPRNGVRRDPSRCGGGLGGVRRDNHPARRGGVIGKLPRSALGVHDEWSLLLDAPTLAHLGFEPSTALIGPTLGLRSEGRSEVRRTRTM